MKAKKILTGALSLAMIVSLAACGGGSSATPTPGTEAPETTTPVTAAPELFPTLPEWHMNSVPYSVP